MTSSHVQAARPSHGRSLARIPPMTTTAVPLDRGRIDKRALRNALGLFATGVAVVTTRSRSGRLAGLTANSFAAVSLEPPLVLWSLRQDAASMACFNDADHFAVNVLGVGQRALSRHFSSPQPDKFAGIAYAAGLGGCPLLIGALAHFECVIENTMPGGDHVIFLGRVLQAAYREGEPLIFANGGYWRPAPIALSAVPQRRKHDE
jgi:flavin reductase (DIM6/NTAB) family NADH-FMN oxidoreductase RutF